MEETLVGFQDFEIQRENLERNLSTETKDYFISTPEEYGLNRSFIDKNPLTINPKSRGQRELSAAVKAYGKCSTRIWDGLEQKLFCYHCQHEEGVIFYYTNDWFYTYEEYSEFSLTNLKIENENNNNVVTFRLEPDQCFFVILTIINKNQSFKYSIETSYKFFN